MSKNQTVQEQSRQPKNLIFFDEIFCFDHENMRRNVKVRVNYEKVRVNLDKKQLFLRKNVKVRVDDIKKGEENGFFYENRESKFSNQSPISLSESFTKRETPLIKGEIKMDEEDTQKREEKNKKVDLV